MFYIGISHIREDFIICVRGNMKELELARTQKKNNRTQQLRAFSLVQYLVRIITN